MWFFYFVVFSVWIGLLFPVYFWWLNKYQGIRFEQGTRGVALKRKQILEMIRALGENDTRRRYLRILLFFHTFLVISGKVILTVFLL
jgi:hypothetical protein